MTKPPARLSVSRRTVYRLMERQDQHQEPKPEGNPMPDLVQIANQDWIKQAGDALGACLKHVAAAYGIHRETLARWLREAGIAVAPPQCPTIAPGGR